MPDREKILHELDHQVADADWCDNDWKDNVPIWMLRGALAILREHEPVTMKPSYFNYICSGCESEVDGEFIDFTGGKIKFCPYCGRKVKWDGDR